MAASMAARSWLRFGVEQPPPLFGGHTVRSLWVDFLIMSLAFSVNHAVSTTPLMMASTLLGGGVGEIGNSVFFLFALGSSLLLAVPATGHLGIKRALNLALALYALYAGGFAAALVVEEPGLRQTTWMMASACGGLAGSLAWTAQGGHFATTASMLSSLTATPREEATSKLASTFSIMYLSTEVVAKLAFSAFHMRLPPASVALGFFYVASFATLSSTCLKDLPGMQQSTPWSRWSGAAKMWSDPAIWLLSPTNFSFGFSASLMNGYINATFASTELGVYSVGALGGLTAAAAAATAFLLGRVPCTGNKAPIIAFGAGCFFAIAFCTVELHCCYGWGRSIAVLYILQGMGRAVYESTNRAVFANFFRGERSEHAFANCTLQVTSSKALCFFLQTRLPGQRLAVAVGVLAAATPVLYSMAAARHWRSQRLKQDILELGENLKESSSDDS